MSSILKALEKVDESQRFRRPAGTGGLPKARGRRPAWMIPVWTLGGAAIATLATYAIMGGFSRQAAQVTPQAPGAVATAAAPVVRLEPKEVVTEQRSAAAAAVPAAAVKPVRPLAGAAKVAAKPAPGPGATAAKHVAQPVVKPVTQAAAKTAAQPQVSAKLAAKQLAQPSGAGKAAAVAQPAPVHPAAVQPVPVVAASAPAAAPVAQKSRPEIRVSGIAWQNSSESSFAMINGSAMRQGNVVNGYKIEQIYEDSVRFSNSKGNTLVVPLGAGEE
ncbi:hypothetical protein [Geomonas propionica]|uniref:General secretion pathway protein GspB n=1 Tax=Geomonas propionica TaxID=2798582 RepID=A0ABS0YVG5_9BACT|nr:hypothetical protein [Geomonas propionica]MBJ6801960.1 hypothetical protein [Geomonas propionica]